MHPCSSKCREDRASGKGHILILAPVYRKYRLNMADEQTSSRLAVSEQEYEQLQTALEAAETEIQVLAQENRQFQMERSQALSENARLRHLLAQCHARLLETQVAARKSVPRPISGLEGELSIVNEELQISLEELQVTAEELEEANAALLRT